MCFNYELEATISHITNLLRILHTSGRRQNCSGVAHRAQIPSGEADIMANNVNPVWCGDTEGRLKKRKHCDYWAVREENMEALGVEVDSMDKGRGGE